MDQNVCGYDAHPSPSLPQSPAAVKILSFFFKWLVGHDRQVLTIRIGRAGDAASLVVVALLQLILNLSRISTKLGCLTETTTLIRRIVIVRRRNYIFYWL